MPHPYCIQSGSEDGDIMPARISLRQLQQLTSETDDPDDIDQNIIDGAIEGGDSLIDGYCGGYWAKYATPFAVVPPLVKDFSSALATFNLFEKRATSVGMPEAIRDSRDDVVNFLKDVAKGVASLGIDPPPKANTLTNAKVTGNKRVFSRDSMNGL
jgi:phage gp36-like protein